MRPLRALAPAKVNLGLFVGPVRPLDGRHEIATVMQAISLADELLLEPAAGEGGADVLCCPGVAGEPEQNLAFAALRAFRAATGWQAPPLRLEIRKRIPVAAGLAGGSADAAAVLRLAHEASGLGDERLLGELAAELGADVPALLCPGRWLATGAGERLERLPDPDPPLELVVLALAAQLATADVYAEADRLGRGRSLQALAERCAALRSQLAAGAALPADLELLENDLQAAAEALCPQISPALQEARTAGAELALTSGSGPTVVALFAGAGAGSQAGGVAAALAGRNPAAVGARSVSKAFGQPHPAAGAARGRRDGRGGADAGTRPADGAVRHNHGDGG